jgi:hypothetical protein
MPHFSHPNEDRIGERIGDRIVTALPTIAAMPE